MATRISGKRPNNTNSSYPKSAGQPRAGHPAGAARLGTRPVNSVHKTSLDALARDQLQAAHAATSGRAARTVYGGHDHALRQTVIALVQASPSPSTTAPAKRPCTSYRAGSDSSPEPTPGTAGRVICSPSRRPPTASKLSRTPRSSSRRHPTSGEPRKGRTLVPAGPVTPTPPRTRATSRAAAVLTRAPVLCFSG
jgi:hypothetical protein